MERWVKRENRLVSVEAVLLNEDNVAEVAAWSGAHIVDELNPEDRDETQQGLNVQTASGPQRAILGMYVIKFGTKFFVSHLRQFEAVYEPESRPAPPPETPADSRRRLGFSDPFDRGRIV